MRKLFAIGTLLLSSAAVMVSPAAAADRNYNNQNYNNQNFNSQNYSRGYVAPAPVHAPVVSSFNDRARFDRDAQIRLEERIRAERRERKRREHARFDFRYFGSFRDRY